MYLKILVNFVSIVFIGIGLVYPQSQKKPYAIAKNDGIFYSKPNFNSEEGSFKAKQKFQTIKEFADEINLWYRPLYSQFVDDFDSDVNNFIYNSGCIKSSLRNGNLIFEYFDDNHCPFYWEGTMIFPDKRIADDFNYSKDYILEASFTINTLIYGSFGIFVGDLGKYFISISALDYIYDDGIFDIYPVDIGYDSKQVTVKNIRFDNLTKLKLFCHFGKIYYYVNDELIFIRKRYEKPDRTLCFGFLMRSAEIPASEVEVQNITLKYNLEKKSKTELDKTFLPVKVKDKMRWVLLNDVDIVWK